MKYHAGAPPELSFASLELLLSPVVLWSLLIHQRQWTVMDGGIWDREDHPFVCKDIVNHLVVLTLLPSGVFWLQNALTLESRSRSSWLNRPAAWPAGAVLIPLEESSVHWGKALASPPTSEVTESFLALLLSHLILTVSWEVVRANHVGSFEQSRELDHEDFRDEVTS